MAEARASAAVVLLVALAAGCRREAAAPAVAEPPIPPPLPVEHLVVAERRPGATADDLAIELVLEPRDLAAQRTLADGTVISVAASVFWEDDDDYRFHGFTYHRDVPMAGGVIVRTELTSDFALHRGERKVLGEFERADGAVQVWVRWPAGPAPAAAAPGPAPR